MNTKNIVLKSITHAMRGQKYLESRGIRSSISRNEEAVSKYGCGYGLRVRRDRVDDAVRLLTEIKIKISAVLD